MSETISCAPLFAFYGEIHNKSHFKERNFIMNNPDRKANLAFDVLVFLLALALLCFITRLWPILLLVILGIFVAALRLLFLSAKKEEAQQPAEPVSQPQRLEPSPAEIQRMAFANACNQITALLRSRYPEASWTWELPDARWRLFTGESVWILLVRAGGYHRARVCMNGLQVAELEYPQPQPAPQPEPPAPADDRPEPEPPAENFELLAFEWVEAHILELNNRCNEAVGRKATTLLLEAAELPQRESWPAICTELAKQDILNAACTPEGIWIRLDGGEAA